MHYTHTMTLSLKAGRGRDPGSGRSRDEVDGKASCRLIREFLDARRERPSRRR